MLDDRGIPTETTDDGTAAPYCPPAPCQLCHNGAKGFEWCQEMNTCAATIDWDKVYGHDTAGN